MHLISLGSWRGRVAVLFIVAIGFAGSLWISLPTQSAPALRAKDERADLILIEKASRQLSLMRDGQIIKTYVVGLGSAPIGDKAREGDGRTPEGRYEIDRRNDRSRFHLSLGLNYPRADQKAAAKAQGIDPGGDIFIHGQPNWLGGLTELSGDWTDGCIAVSNGEIEEIWTYVDAGTEVRVEP